MSRMRTRQARDTAHWAGLPRGDYGCQAPPPENLADLKLLDLKADLVCGHHRGEIRPPPSALLGMSAFKHLAGRPRREDMTDSASDAEEEERELEQRAQKERADRRRAQADAAQVWVQECAEDVDVCETEAHALDAKELLDRKKSLLQMTPLHLRASAQQREEIAAAADVIEITDPSKAKLVEAGSRGDALYMIAHGSCTVSLHLKDGGSVEAQRSHGDWFPYPLMVGTAAPYDLDAAPGSTLLVIRGKENLQRLVKPIVCARIEMHVQALTEVFRGLPRYEAVRLMSIASVFDTRKEQVAIREGTLSGHLVVMVRGNCMLTKDGVRLSACAAPHVFGQVSVHHDLPNPVSVTSMTDSEFLLLPKRELVALVQSVAGLKVQDTQQKL
jgi:CRP-like cAMP-binding protein